MNNTRTQSSKESVKQSIKQSIKQWKSCPAEHKISKTIVINDGNVAANNISIIKLLICIVGARGIVFITVSGGFICAVHGSRLCDV
jgi:hypothetical protein